ncbi:hypothetical protein ACFLRF_06395 [Candidatus Altiarchaeota archaeon]
MDVVTVEEVDVEVVRGQQHNSEGAHTGPAPMTGTKAYPVI